jgi:hypothetical protein
MLVGPLAEALVEKKKALIKVAALIAKGLLTGNRGEGEGHPQEEMASQLRRWGGAEIVCKPEVKIEQGMVVLAAEHISELARVAVKGRQVILELDAVLKQVRGQAGKKLLDLKPELLALGLDLWQPNHRS